MFCALRESVTHKEEPNWKNCVTNKLRTPFLETHQSDNYICISSVIEKNCSSGIGDDVTGPQEQIYLV